ncbi:Protein SGT1 -like protein [Triplophysa tibetana]|uniref:Protein SGT1-like protein n=1 Tax=Triplophysa tibetana TaxID=1572043 RepID=A0A5A9PMT3_9TELE|nr:Protein SGT1 -like protein [Triplophysa tibetana]
MAKESTRATCIHAHNPEKHLDEANLDTCVISGFFYHFCLMAWCSIVLENAFADVNDVTPKQSLINKLQIRFLRVYIDDILLRKFVESYKEIIKIVQLDKRTTLIQYIFSYKAFYVLLHRVADYIQQQSQHVKHDWYQTESLVVVTIMLKNAQKDDVSVDFDAKKLTAVVKLLSGEDYCLNVNLLHPIVPEQSTYRILSTKIEIKMKKTEGIHWEKLEGEGSLSTVKHFTPNQYPSSSHYTRNWDKVVGEIKEEEKNENLEGDAALNKLFHQIYSDGTDEVKRAMNKSFMESGGTVLSTNWTDVGKRKVEMNPPEDVEWKKY